MGGQARTGPEDSEIRTSNNMNHDSPTQLIQSRRALDPHHGFGRSRLPATPQARFHSCPALPTRQVGRETNLADRGHIRICRLDIKSYEVHRLAPLHLAGRKSLLDYSAIQHSGQGLHLTRFATARHRAARSRQERPNHQGRVRELRYVDLRLPQRPQLCGPDQFTQEPTALQWAPLNSTRAR